MWNSMVLDVECIVCNKTLHKMNHNPRRETRDMGKVPNNRRLRTPNWSLEEKQYLLELIKTRKDVVVTKNNNGPNYSEEKDVAWNEILRELAIKFGSKFQGSSIKKVKTQWQNMKRIAREEISSNGQMLQRYSRQSLEVCNILEIVKDGVMKVENQNTNEIIMTANVEIKTECIDEEIDQPTCSGVNTNPSSIIPSTQQNPDNLSRLDSSTTSLSEQNSENIDFDITDNSDRRNASVMTESPNNDNRYNNYTNLQREIQEYFKYTATEKQLKLESLKEERQIIRAMRETAELNKIIAEQRLKHVLWVKKQEMAMYSGEPGSGAGKGGGGGGAIREAGGAFGKMEAAREDEYFYKKQIEQLSNLKGHLSKEIAFHQDQIKRHEDAIRRHKEKMAEMENK